MTREITVSYSEIQAARRCPMKHKLAWQEGWRKPQPPDSALGFGIAWHKVMNAYYDGLRGTYKFVHIKDTKHWQSKSGWHAARDAILSQPKEIQDRLRWMLEGYAAQYGTEPGWTVLATEKEFIVPLPQIFQDLKVNLKVKIDLIIKDPKGNIWVDDHKTCAQLPTQKQQVDPQLPLYLYAMGMSNWIKPFGARYSYARKPSKTFVDWPLEKRFKRRLVAHNDREIRSVARDAYTTIYMRYMEAGLFALPPRNVAPDCSYTCDFVSACEASRKGYRLYDFLEDQNFSAYRLNDPKMPKEPDDERS